MTTSVILAASYPVISWICRNNFPAISALNNKYQHTSYSPSSEYGTAVLAFNVLIASRRVWNAGYSGQSLENGLPKTPTASDLKNSASTDSSLEWRSQAMVDRQRQPLLTLRRWSPFDTQLIKLLHFAIPT